MVYPQLSSGSLAQFPIRKQQLQRTVVNAALDGSSIRLADPNGASTQWVLSYAGLTDSEREALEAFFEAAEGSLNGFTFLDPAANLLAWSDRLTNAVWQAGPLVGLTASVADPAGGTLAWKLANSGAGAQSVSQTIQAPAGYQYCLSVYLRADQTTTVTLLAGSQQAAQVATTGWARATFGMTGDPTASSITFGIQLPAGATAYVYGMQVEAQAGASQYKSSTTGGIYTSARLASDALTVTTTGVGQHACTVNIINVNNANNL
jgi:hypothetical protein